MRTKEKKPMVSEDLTAGPLAVDSLTPPTGHRAVEGGRDTTCTREKREKLLGRHPERL